MGIINRSNIRTEVGVDLNRNFGYMFDVKGSKGSSTNPCAEDYRGEYEFSEPET